MRTAITKLAKYVLKVVPLSLAIPIVDLLVTTIRRPAATPDERNAMAAARRRSYGEAGESIAWMWGERGPWIVLVHGWGGTVANMAPLAVGLADQGFRCVALEVTGHDSSRKRRTRWDYFIKDISALSHSLQDGVYAYVGHSAGGLTMMAARDLKGIKAQRYVCICAPSLPWLARIEGSLNQRRAVVDGYRQYTADQFQTTWAKLQAGCAFSNLGPDLLLFYDKKDRFLPDTEGDKINALCPGSTLLKTDKYGHVRILAAPELISAVGDFLAEPSRLRVAVAG